MSLRRARQVLACALALALSACVLSPLPDLPSGSEDGAGSPVIGTGGSFGASGGDASQGTGGTTVVDGGNAGGLGGEGGSAGAEAKP